jgi:hypothetical protein
MEIEVRISQEALRTLETLHEPILARVNRVNDLEIGQK